VVGLLLAVSISDLSGRKILPEVGKAYNRLVTSQAPVAERRRAAHLGPERRRPLVLDAAMGVFLEHGFEGASMDAIANAAGVSKPVVYDCFANKGELFEALFQREEARVIGEIGAALPAAAPNGAEAALADGFTAFLRAVAASPEAYRTILLGEGGMSANVARRIRAGREQQVAAAVTAASGWLDLRQRDDAASLALFGETLIGVGEAGARALLDAGGDWTPESLGPRLAQVAVVALPGGTAAGEEPA
jgi:AcrR family transcriptional regulator